MYAQINGTRIFFDVEGMGWVPDGPRLREKPVCFVLHGGPGGDHTGYKPGLSPLADYMQLGIHRRRKHVPIDPFRR